MNADQRELLAQAISGLKLRDVMLNACSFRRPAAPPTPAEAGEASEVRQLTKRAVKFVVGDMPTDHGATKKLLQVIVELGIRITGLAEANAPIYFEIEADFLVEYELKADLSEAAIKVFADINSVHNVWPFWRQHVFDVVSRGRLPHLEIPLFSGTLPEQSSPAPTAQPPSRKQSPARRAREQ